MYRNDINKKIKLKHIVTIDDGQKRIKEILRGCKSH